MTYMTYDIVTISLQVMPATDGTVSHNIIKDCSMKKKLCIFGFFYQAEEENIEKLLLQLSNNKPPSTDNPTVNYPELKPNISPSHYVIYSVSV